MIRTFFSFVIILKLCLSRSLGNSRIYIYIYIFLSENVEFYAFKKIPRAKILNFITFNFVSNLEFKLLKDFAFRAKMMDRHGRVKKSRKHVRDTREKERDWRRVYIKSIAASLNRSPSCAVTSGTRQPRLSRYKSAKLDNLPNFRAAPSSTALKNFTFHNLPYISLPPEGKNKAERNVE